jgi:uncharacterized membrane protein
MFCHKCGTQVGPGVQFCANCGESLQAASSASGGAAPPVWTPPAGVQARPGTWVGQGWQMVKADIGTFMLLTIVFAVLNTMVPMILQGPLIAGFQIFCMKKLLNRRTDFADLFKGFNFFVPALVASLLITLFTFCGTLVCIIPGLVVAAMFNFTFLFIVDKRMDFWPAMQASHAVVKSDYFGFTMFLLLMVLVDILGALCCIVGLVVAVPVTVAAVTVAYKEIVGFDPRTAETL